MLQWPVFNNATVYETRLITTVTWLPVHRFKNDYEVIEMQLKFMLQWLNIYTRSTYISLISKYYA